MKVFREPLVHLLAAGAVLFAADAWLEPDEGEADAVAAVTITEGDVRWVVETWRRQWLREPAPSEIRGMIDELVEEELLAREALAMGLEQDDTVVRRRLAQKLKFLVEDTTRLAEPTEAELRTWHAEHQDRFRTDDTVSFTQVFFNPAGREDAEADARAMLVAVSGDGMAAATTGDRLLVDGSFSDLDHRAVAALFGPGFADAVFAIEPGSWSGPFASGYGQHLVLVAARTSGRPLTFEEARDAVTAEWSRDREDATRRDYMALLRAKYPVAMDDGVRALLDGAQPAEAAPQ